MIVPWASRAGELARARATRNLTDDDCLIWFGVGLATIERVEAGEIEPDAELAGKIDRFLAIGGGVSAAAPSKPTGGRVLVAPPIQANRDGL